MIESILFTKEECEKIINFSETYQRGYHINNNSDSQTNSLYKGYNIPKNNETSFVWEKLFNFFENTSNKKLYKWPMEFYLMKYDKGDRFKLHNDARGGRIYSIGICLNDEYDGGDFLVEKNEITKTTGNAYFFEAIKEHEVTEITNGIRWSIISFIHDVDLMDFKQKKMI
jgi:hypothetical protein